MTEKMCEFCKLAIRQDDEAVTCPRCKKVYHKECWDLIGECNCPKEQENSKNLVELKVQDYHEQKHQSKIPSNNVDMVTHILLLLFTFGIYYCVWIYKTTEYTNVLKPDEERSATGNLLLCIFIPFYIIYWYCKTVQILSETIVKNDNDFKTIIIIFSVFIPIVSAILVQDKINKVGNSEIVENNSNDDNNAFEEIKKLKELLDMNAITQEEFDKKKY